MVDSCDQFQTGSGIVEESGLEPAIGAGTGSGTGDGIRLGNRPHRLWNRFRCGSGIVGPGCGTGDVAGDRDWVLSKSLAEAED